MICNKDTVYIKKTIYIEELSYIKEEKWLSIDSMRPMICFVPFKNQFSENSFGRQNQNCFEKCFPKLILESTTNQDKPQTCSLWRVEETGFARNVGFSSPAMITTIFGSISGCSTCEGRPGFSSAPVLEESDDDEFL